MLESGSLLTGTFSRTSTMEYSAWSRVAGGFTVPSLTPLRAALATQCLEYDDMELSVQSDVGINITTGRGRGG